MFESLVRFFINKPKIGNLVLIFIIITGLISFKATVNQGYPTVDFGLVSITTTYPGAASNDIETQITQPLENELKSVSGIDYISSVSLENVSQIFVKIKDGNDFDEAKEDIQKAVDRVATFPADLEKPTIFELNNDAIPVFEVAITGSAPYEKKRFYTDILERRLRTNESIGKIEKVGYRKKETQINLDPTKLEKNYIAISEVLFAISAGNIRAKSGDLFVSGLENELVVDSEYNYRNPIKNAIIRSGFDGNRVLLTDIAMISTGFEKEKNIIRVNGRDALTLIIQKKPEADITDASKNINDILETFEKELPETIQIQRIVDYSTETFTLLKLVKDNAYVGLGLILISLILLLTPKLRSGLRLAFQFQF